MGARAVIVVTEAEIEADLRAAVRKAMTARAGGWIVECPSDFYYLHYGKEIGLDQPPRQVAGPAKEADRGSPAEASRILERFPKLVKVLQGVRWGSRPGERRGRKPAKSNSG